MGDQQTRPVYWVILLVLVALVGIGKQVFDPVYTPCAACEHTGILSCGASGCVHGSAPCPGNCLKADDPRWQHMDVAGHPPEDVWVRFDNPGGGWSSWNQHHVGDVIEMVDGHWVNQGRCPLCNGTTQVVCPVCGGRNLCTACRGRGRIRHWLAWN